MTKQKPRTPAATIEPACAPEWTETLRQMILIRRFEEATEREFRRGRIGGYLHVYIGQEAIASGVINALKKGDAVFCGYRDHGQARSSLRRRAWDLCPPPGPQPVALAGQHRRGVRKPHPERHFCLSLRDRSPVARGALVPGETLRGYIGNNVFRRRASK